MSRRGYFAVAVALTPAYAACYSAIKVGLAYAPPLRFGGLRAVIAGVSLLVLLRLTGRPIFLPARLWRGTTAIAITGTLLAYGAMFMSPGRTGAGIASVLGNTTPLVATALAVPFLGETVSRAKAAALALGFVGAALVAYPALPDPTLQGVAGALFPLGAAAGFAISSVLLKKLYAKEAVLQVAAWQLLLGGVLLLALSALLEPRAAIEWAAAFIGLMLFLSLIGSALTTAVWFWLVQREDVGLLSISLFFVPVLGLGIAVSLFDERLGIPEAVGVGLILASLAGVALDGRRDVRVG